MVGRRERCPACGPPSPQRRAQKPRPIPHRASARSGRRAGRARAYEQPWLISRAAPPRGRHNGDSLPVTAQTVTGRLLAATLLVACLQLAPARAQEPAAMPSTPATLPAANGQWTHAITLMGQPKYGPDFKHFDYADPAAPKGGDGAPRRAGRLRQLQPRRRRPEGRPRRRRPADLRYADDRVLGRAVHLLRPARRGGAGRPRPRLGLVPPARERPLARRQADHPRGRGLVLRRAEGQQPVLRRLLPDGREGRGDRAARGHLHLHRDRQPRAAAGDRAAARPAQALVDRQGRQRQATQRHRDDPGAAAGLRPLPAGEVRRPAAPRPTPACPTTGARTCR